MTTWPETLPQKFLVRGYAEEPPNNVLRTPMDQGPAKARRRSTDAVWRYTGLMKLTGAQLSTWLTFYYDMIKEVGVFDFPHPRTGSTIEVRVVNHAPPYRPINANDQWELSLSLEELPG